MLPDQPSLILKNKCLYSYNCTNKNIDPKKIVTNKLNTTLQFLIKQLWDQVLNNPLLNNNKVPKKGKPK